MSLTTDVTQVDLRLTDTDSRNKKKNKNKTEKPKLFSIICGSLCQSL